MEDKSEAYINKAKWDKELRRRLKEQLITTFASELGKNAIMSAASKSLDDLEKLNVVKTIQIYMEIGENEVKKENFDFVIHLLDRLKKFENEKPYDTAFAYTCIGEKAVNERIEIISVVYHKCAGLKEIEIRIKSNEKRDLIEKTVWSRLKELEKKVPEDVPKLLKEIERARERVETTIRNSTSSSGLHNWRKIGSRNHQGGNSPLPYKTKGGVKASV